MEVLHKESEGMFYIEQDGEVVAEMTYRRVGDDRMSIDHTWADERLQGTGAAKQLLESAVSYAREKGWKIIPLCPYVKHQFDKNPDLYKEVIA